MGQAVREPKASASSLTRGNLSELLRGGVGRSGLFNKLTGCRERRPRKIKAESGRPWGMGESGDREGGCALGSELKGEGEWGLGLDE